jgi:hypothetical protein
MTTEGVARLDAISDISKAVMAGLDPAIHRCSKTA